jgi:hypothetical protein
MGFTNIGLILIPPCITRQEAMTLGILVRQVMQQIQAEMAMDITQIQHAHIQIIALLQLTQAAEMEIAQIVLGQTKTNTDFTTMT